MYVDDALIVAVHFQMRRMLRAVVAAFFTVCGEPETDKRQSPLAMDKWGGLVIAHQSVLLGLVFNTRRLTVTVAMTEDYLAELRELIAKTWHKNRKCFYINELEVLLGKFARLGEAANWIYHLLTHMYSSASFALRGNEEFLGNRSQSFIAYISRKSRT